MKRLEDFAMETKKKPWEVEEVEWREVRLGEIGVLQYGYTQKANHDGKGPKFLRITDIDLETSQVNWDNVPYCDIDKKNYVKYKLKDGDILIARIGGTTGKACIIKNPPESVFASYLIRFSIVDKESISPDFIYYFTKSRKYWDQIALGRIGKLKEGVNATQLKNLKIPLPFRNGKPDLETQKKIVEYIEANFSKIDKILEKKKKELERLDELWESVLGQAFKLKEGEEWREVRLGDKNYFHIETGATPKTSVKEYWENGTIKWATPKDLGKNNGKYLFDTDRKITEAGLNSCSTTLIPKGSILISTRAPIGHIAILGDEMCFNQGCKGIVIKTSQILNEFIYYGLLTKVELMKILGTGPTFEELSKDKLGTVKIPIPFRNGKPDLETQKEIANYLDEVYEKIKMLKEKIQNQIAQLEEMKESILDEVFNHGEAG